MVNDPLFTNHLTQTLTIVYKKNTISIIMPIRRPHPRDLFIIMICYTLINNY